MNSYKRNLAKSIAFTLLLFALLIKVSGFRDGISTAFVILALLINSWHMVLIFSIVFKIPTKTIINFRKITPQIIISFLCWLLAGFLMFKDRGLGSAILGLAVPILLGGSLSLAIKMNKKPK